jgi:hypothetical protein
MSEPQPEPRDEEEERGPEDESRAASEVRTVARGRAARTPFVAMAGVAAVVWVVAGLIALAVLLIWLLA